MKLYTMFKTQDLENHALFSGTYPFRPNRGVRGFHTSLLQLIANSYVLLFFYKALIYFLFQRLQPDDTAEESENYPQKLFPVEVSIQQ